MSKRRVSAVLILEMIFILPGAIASPAGRPKTSQEMPKELASLIRNLKSPSPEVHQAAALKLRDMGPGAAAAVPALIEALGMGRFYWDGLDDKGSMTGGSIDYSGSAAMILAAIGQPAVPPLLQVLKSGNRPGTGNRQSIRAEAARVLGIIKDERAVEALLQALKDPVYEVSFAASEALLAFADPAILDRLAAALNAPNADYRNIVARMFIKKKDTRVFPYVQGQLRSPYPDVRAAGLSDLEAYGGERVLPIVTGMLDKDPDKHVRARAARILGDLANPAALEPLLRALKAPEAEVRASAAAALGQLGDQRAVAPLTALLKDPQPEVRDAAAAALRNIKGKIDEAHGVSFDTAVPKIDTVSVPGSSSVSVPPFRARHSALPYRGLAKNAAPPALFLNGTAT
jgi:HEAT repeat protein